MLSIKKFLATKDNFINYSKVVKVFKYCYLHGNTKGMSDCADHLGVRTVTKVLDSDNSIVPGNTFNSLTHKANLPEYVKSIEVSKKLGSKIVLDERKVFIPKDSVNYKLYDKDSPVGLDKQELLRVLNKNITSNPLCLETGDYLPECDASGKVLTADKRVPVFENEILEI